MLIRPLLSGFCSVGFMGEASWNLGHYVVRGTWARFAREVILQLNLDSSQIWKTRNYAMWRSHGQSQWRESTQNETGPPHKEVRSLSTRSTGRSSAIAETLGVLSRLSNTLHGCCPSGGSSGRTATLWLKNSNTRWV